MIRPRLLHPFLIRSVAGAAAAALPAETEWHRIVDEACAHRLSALLLHRLHADGVLSCLPTDAAFRLRQAAHDAAGRALFVSRMLDRVMAALARCGVPCIPLRGPRLAERLYGDACLRPCDDLDVLVRRGDLAAAGEALAALGFHEYAHRRDFASTFSYTDAHQHAAEPIVVEPHWTLGYPPFHACIDMDGVWRRAGSTERDGELTLEPTDALVHLCFHANHHGHGTPVLWLLDLHRWLVIYETRLDWDRLCAVAEQTRQGPMLAQVLRETQAIFASPVPEARLADLQTRGARLWLERRVIAPLLQHGQIACREELAQVMSLQGLRPKLRYAAGLLFPSRTFMAARYGDTTALGLVGCYFRRLWQLSRQVGGAIGTLLLGQLARRA